MGRRSTIVWFALFFLLSFSATAFAALNRISGNGYIFPENLTYKAIFSIDASKDGANPPSGLVKYYYSRTRMNMVSTAITDLTNTGVGTTSVISGRCTVNNVTGYTFGMTLTDGRADSIQIVIRKPDGNIHYSAGPKNFSGGNIVITDTIPPTVLITSPQNLITVATTPITVSGTVNDPTAVLTVNGIAVPIVNGSFTVPNIVITEGMNTIAARAVDPANNEASASVNISLDSTPPHVTITSPPDGYRTTTSPLTVTGTINDIVRGTVNENQGRVLVNGTEAGVSNRNFLAEIPLSAGANTITAFGADQWGNTASTSITVNFDTTPRRMLNLVSGNNQSGLVSSTLPNPLMVSLVDETGVPASEGTYVVFKVLENNGSVSDNSSEGRSIRTQTDANGQAKAFFTLGSWAGSGNNRVEVTATGVDGSVIFTASGTQKPPAAIYVAQGSQQRGAVNQPLPEPLVAFVTDEGHNPLRDVPVIFSVAEGGGHFSNGQDSITVPSDSDGRAAVAFTLGPNAGNDSNVVNATFAGNTLPPAGFTATSLVPGDPGNTRISGVVLDNSNNPIPNVTMRIEGTTREALTDAAGQFVINNVPVGPVHLIADGSTAGTPNVLEYPTLMYELTTVSGADNTVGMPIYLVPLDIANAQWVGGSEDVTYTIPSVPGFSLTIKANSVTFPDGRKQGLISVTQVHADKVPMVPQIGQQPRFIVTIQPPGTVFDPPAPITIPNVDGLAPGEKTNMYSFDHDLGVFVSIGTGTVSDDGLVIDSDPGVGVVKAGWHCGGNPATTGSTNDCGDCGICVNNICEPIKVSAIDISGLKKGPDGNGYYEPTDDPLTLNVTVHLTPSGINNTKIRLVVSVDPMSGGHTHGANRPSPKIKSDISSQWVTEDDFNVNNSEIVTIFKPSMGYHYVGGEIKNNNNNNEPEEYGVISGTYTISVKCGDKVIGSKNIIIKHFLDRLADDNDLYYLKKLDTYHNNGDYHYGTANANALIIKAANKYNQDYGTKYSPNRKIVVNDQSLEGGGVFDLNGSWGNPHQLHRHGINVDFPFKYYDSEVCTNLCKFPIDELGEVDKSFMQLKETLYSIIGSCPIDNNNHFHCEAK